MLPIQDFCPAAFKIKSQRYEGVALFIDLAVQPLNFVFVQKQFSRPQGIMVVVIGKRVGCYVQLVNEHFAVFDAGVGIFDICPAHSQRFHLGAFELQPGFVLIDDEIISSGLAILRNDLYMLIIQW